MDKLLITGLDVWARVGCTAAERAFPQKIVVDVVLTLPLADAGRKDDLRLSVDYAAVAQVLKKALEGKEYRLIESMAEDAARMLLADRRVKTAVVKVVKRALPGIESAAVEITRPGTRGRQKR